MATSHMSGPLAMNTPSFSLSLPATGTTMVSSASGTILSNWRACMPGYPTTVWEMGATFPRGGTASPQGGTFRLKVWSGTTAKGVFAGALGGGTVENLRLTLSGGATFAAGADFGVSMHTAGATVAGRAPRLMVYLSYR